MNYFYRQQKISKQSKRGFVLPFTLLISAIMLLISVGIAAVLMKQIYFSNLGKQSQLAYYAADAALACAISIEDTYVDGVTGIFPDDVATSTTAENITAMDSKLQAINNLRALMDPPLSLLAPTLGDIKCAQSEIFNTASPYDFEANTVFHRIVPAHEAIPATTEDGITSTFNMKMQIAGGEYRCARVTVNKTPTYKQIIAQGYSRCGSSVGTIERAVVYTTVN